MRALCVPRRARRLIWRGRFWGAAPWKGHTAGRKSLQTVTFSSGPRPEWGRGHRTSDAGCTTVADLLGRADECAVLDALVDAIQSAEGRALVVRGEAGSVVRRCAVLVRLTEQVEPAEGQAVACPAFRTVFGRRLRSACAVGFDSPRA